MDPLSAVLEFLGLGSSAVGSYLSSKQYLKGVQDTNATNLQIARETNQQQVDLFNQSQSYNTEMWNKQNAYNSPAAVRARLIQAGISPSALSDASQASLVSSNTPPQLQRPEMQAPGLTPNALQAFGGAAKDFLSSQLLAEQVKQAKQDSYMRSVDAQFYTEEKTANLKKQIGEIISKRVQTASDRIRLKFLYSQLRNARTLDEKNIRLADANYDNAIKAGHEIDERINASRASTLRLDAESRQKIASMKVDDAVKWFSAKTQRELAHANIHLSASQQEKIEHEIYALHWQNQDSILNLKKDLQTMDFAEKYLSCKLLAVKLSKETQMSEAEIGSWIRENLGVDVNDVLGKLTLR